MVLFMAGQALRSLSLFNFIPASLRDNFNILLKLTLKYNWYYRGNKSPCFDEETAYGESEKGNHISAIIASKDAWLNFRVIPVSKTVLFLYFRILNILRRY